MQRAGFRSEGGWFDEYKRVWVVMQIHLQM